MSPRSARTRTGSSTWSRTTGRSGSWCRGSATPGSGTVGRARRGRGVEPLDRGAKSLRRFGASGRTLPVGAVPPEVAMLARSAALLLLLATAASANPNCPSNTVQAGETRVSTNPSESASVSGNCGFGSASASCGYSIPGASLTADASDVGDCGAFANVTVVDDFRVVGVPAGTPVAITAVLHVDCYNAGASMSDAFGHSVSFAIAFEPGTVDRSLPIAALAEQPFRLTFTAGAGADYARTGSQVNASFHFTGLPPGTAVVSCNGYVSDQSVAVRPASWGRLKSLYR